MSSIIKGQRIRNETIINLSHRMDTDPLILNNNEEASLLEVVAEESTEQFYQQTKLQMEAMLQQAKSEANALLVEAQEKASQIEQSAYDRQKDIMQQVEDNRAHLLEEAQAEAQRLIDEGNIEKQYIIQQAEGDLVDTLTQLLNYLVGEGVYHHTSWLICVVRKMLQQENLKNHVQVLVSPSVYERLSETDKRELLKLQDDITIQPSQTISETACHVITEQGSIEYDIIEGLQQVIQDIRILQNVK